MWTSSTKGTKITFNGSDNKFATPGDLPESLYVEGIAASGSVRDVELTLSYTKDGITHKDKIKFTVVKVDLDIDADYDGDIDTADDSIEESAGGAVGLNNDDDDNDNNVDRTEAGTVSGEDDLVEIKLALTPSLDEGEVKLEAPSGSSKIKIWENSTKGTEVSLPKTWNLSTDTLPASLYVEGQSASANGRDVELKLSYTDPNSNLVADDKVKVTVCELIFASFGDGEHSGNQPELETYLINTAGATKRGNTFTDVNASGKSFIVEIVNSQSGLKSAMHTQDAYVAFGGHSNYGFGPAFSSSITSISGFMNIGTTNVGVNYPAIRENQQPNFVVQDGEIANSVQNYNTAELSLERFPNVTWNNPPEGWPSLDRVNPGSNFPDNYYRTGYEKMHYYATQSTSNTRLLVSAGSADKPTLKYKKMLIKGCYTKIYYTDTLNHGVLFHTTREASSTSDTIKEFVKGVIENKTNTQIQSALNTEEGDDIYEYHQF